LAWNLGADQSFFDYLTEHRVRTRFGGVDSQLLYEVQLVLRELVPRLRAKYKDNKSKMGRVLGVSVAAGTRAQEAEGDAQRIYHVVPGGPVGGAGSRMRYLSDKRVEEAGKRAILPPHVAVPVRERARQMRRRGRGAPGEPFRRYSQT